MLSCSFSSLNYSLLVAVGSAPERLRKMPAPDELRSAGTMEGALAKEGRLEPPQQASLPGTPVDHPSRQA